MFGGLPELHLPHVGPKLQVLMVLAMFDSDVHKHTCLHRNKSIHVVCKFEREGSEGNRSHRQCKKSQIVIWREAYIL